jgi:hypothetical protein
MHCKTQVYVKYKIKKQKEGLNFLNTNTNAYIERSWQAAAAAAHLQKKMINHL